MEQHPLKHEIIATNITNEMINRVGPTFVHHIEEETGATTADVVRAYLLTREIFDFVSLWEAIEGLDNQIPDAVQADMLIQSERLMTRGTLWFLRYHHLHQDIAKTVKHFVAGVQSIAGSLEDFMTSDEKASVKFAADRWIQSGVPVDLATRLAKSDSLYSALDIVEISAAAKRTVKVVGSVYFAIGGKLNFAWLSGQIGALPADTHWQSLAKMALRDDVSRLQTELTSLVLKGSPGGKSEDALIAEWESRAARELSRCLQILADLRAAGNPDLSMLSVVIREFKSLASLKQAKSPP
jgi:glutamate dehydrogenase